MSKKDAAVYLRAAELIGGQFNYSCQAIQSIATGSPNGCVINPHRLVDKYQKMFAPELPLRRPNVDWGLQWPDPNNCRILALCFAAAMAETGDL